MPPKTKAQIGREGNLMKARFVKQQLEITRSWKQIQSLLDGGQFTFSVLESGVGYTTADSILLRNDILPPSESTYYDHLDEVCDAIISFTDECIKQQYQKMSPNTVISIDGSWDHVRHAKHCIVAVIDQTQKKKLFIMNFLKRWCCRRCCISRQDQ